MTIAEDFDTGISSTAGGGDLCEQWPPLVRALKSLTDMGVAMDAGLITPNTVNGALTLDAFLKCDDYILLAEAGASQWQLATESGALRLTDIGGNTPLRIENGSIDNALYIRSDGNIGLGGTGSASNKLLIEAANEIDFRMTRSGASVALALSSGNSSDNATIYFQENTTTYWAVRKAGDQTFVIRDDANSNDVAVIEHSAPASALYIDADGHVGLGRDPATSHFVIDPGVDASTLYDLDSGSSAAQDATLRFLDRGTSVWAFRKASGGNFVIIDNADSNAIPVSIASGVGTGALVLNADGSIDLDTNHRVRAANASQSTDTGSATNVLFATEAYDVGGWHSTSSNTDQFVVPSAGTYIITAASNWAADADGLRSTAITVNGTAVATSSQPANASGLTRQTACWMGILAAAQVVRLQVTQTSGDTIANSCEISITKVA